MTKLVLVTNKYCFDADYQKALNLFNQELQSSGKSYYIELKLIDNLTSDEEEDDLTSYSLKYQYAVKAMQENGEQADIIAMANIDDSSGYSDYDYFFVNDMLMPLDEYIAENDALDKNISKAEWMLAKRNGKTYAVPTSCICATGRGWEIDTSSITKLGITADDLQGEIWDILDEEKLHDKKIYADTAAENFNSGSGNPLPPYNSDQYYDLITSCVGVSLDDDKPTAINIFNDEYMQKSIKTVYELSDLEESDLCLYPAAVTDSKVTKNNETTYIPIDGKLYLTGDLCGLGIAKWSENAECAFDLIQTLNSDSKMAMLLNYGVEGENYTLNTDGSVTVTDSQFENYKNPYYIFSNRSVLPDDVAIKKGESIENAFISPLCGFIFDGANVETEIEKTNAVLEKYRDTLFKGEGDCDDLLKEFENELEEAGVQKIADEANRQISDWQELN
ncbi:MAG: ABC transporter substrate-binding protein [Acutalibacteraceae bacterium]